jgi:hypothetical protein
MRLRNWQLPGLIRCIALAPHSRHLAAANQNGTI